MLLAETFWDVFWWMMIAFFWVMFFWIFITLFADIIRRDDIGGGKKAVWIGFLVILPFIGALAYIIARPKMTAGDVAQVTRMEAASRAAAGVSKADELAKLSELRSQGVLSEQEYEDLKRATLAR
jgi:hypothetical protein